MAFMSGSPVLTDKKFSDETQQAGGVYGMGIDRPTAFAAMTIGGSVTATAVLLILLVGAGAFGWSLVPEAIPVTNPVTGVVTNPGISVIPGWVFLAIIGGLVFGIITSLKPKLARITAPLYSLTYGIALGAISKVYNQAYEGIVTQAVFATMGIFTAMLVLYATRIIKVTNRFVMIVVGCTFGIMLMYLFAFVVSLFGVHVGFLYDGSPLAILISVGIIIIAALNLAIDFAFIEKGSAAGAPKYMEWYAAFGITVTLVWIYLEVLRLVAMLNRR